MTEQWGIPKEPGDGVESGATGVGLAELMATAPPGPRACPVAASLQIVGERWSLLIIRELSYGVRRFDQIVGYTGAPRDILTDRLRKLEASGVIERRQYSDRPRRFEYYLTEAGRQLRPVLLALSEWGSVWAQDPPTAMFDHDCGELLEVDQVCRHCARPVTSAGIRLHTAKAD
ncbi:MAG TPA: helix-turn-helix domain-containing protein [Pseudonocardiaceae bacterium]|nr:helix-turn-helix domain-containing protein [Pseudonocardiaceae bacterium]